MILRRAADGTWSNLDGGLQTPPGNTIDALALGPDGVLYVGGNGFSRVDGGVGTRFLQWDPLTDSWTRVGTLGDPNGTVSAIAVHPGTGDVYIGGAFTAIGSGVPLVASRVARYERATNAWFALGAGTNGLVTSLAFDAAGNLWAVGEFTQAGGVAAQYAAMWNGASWLDRDGSNTAPFQFAQVLLGPDGAMWGQAPNKIVRWDGTFWVDPIATLTGGNVSRIEWYKGALYAAGSFTGINGVPMNGIGRYLSSGAWEPLGDLLQGGGNPYGTVHLPDGSLIAYGSFTDVGGVATLGGLAQWDGAQWTPVVNVLPYSGTIFGVTNMVAGADGSIALSWTGSGSVKVPGITTVTNAGSAPAFPIIEITGTGSLYSIENLTTGQVIRFAAPFVYGGETLRLDLRPGKKTARSATRDFLPYVMTSSDFATWALDPGENRIALYCDFAGTANLRYRRRDWAAD
jgi:hypothetical protein